MKRMPSPKASLLGSHRGSSPALDRRGWNLALAFQEVFTAIVRLRYNRQSVPSGEAFRAHIKQALRVAEQEARSGGYSAEESQAAVFALVAFLDESALSCRNPAFCDWARLPLQAELYGNQLAGEVFFQELQKAMNRSESRETADLLEVYYLCLLLGFKGRYAAGGDLRAIMDSLHERIRRVRGPSGPLSPRGAIPSEAVRLTQSDPWVRRLAIAAAASAVLAVALFVIFKLLLISGASELSATAAQLVK
jgi:type VI secretion system protein ImpK